MATTIWAAQQLDDTILLTSTLGYPLPETRRTRAASWLIIPFHAPTIHTPTIWVDHSIIITHTWDYHSPETQGLRPYPTPRRPPRNPHYPPPGYVIPPRMRHPRRSNILTPVALEPTSYTYEIPEQQYEENQSRTAGSGLSTDCIFEFLMGCLGCPGTEKEICTICQDELQVEEKMVTLSCSHMYHLGCIEKWLRIKNECVVCRASVI